MSDRRRPARIAGRPAAAAGAVLAGALGYVALVDPHDPGSVYPPCPFKLLTGWNCPFCGGLRMTHDLLHGDLPAAVHDNLFLLVLLPACLLLGAPVAAARVARRDGPAPPAKYVAVAVAVAAAVWTVVRNLPGFPLVPTVTG